VAFSNLEIGRPLGHLVNPHNANASKSKPTQPIKPVVAASPKGFSIMREASQNPTIGLLSPLEAMLRKP